MTRGDRGGDDRGGDVDGGWDPSKGLRQALLTQGLLRVFGPPRLLISKQYLHAPHSSAVQPSHVPHRFDVRTAGVMTRPAKGSLSVT